jgi:hypothetical protein
LFGSISLMAAAIQPRSVATTRADKVTTHMSAASIQNAIESPRNLGDEPNASGADKHSSTAGGGDGCDRKCGRHRLLHAGAPE